MSETEIPPLGNHKQIHHLDLAGRELVHDIATPLATLQLNLQVLATYLPVLLRCYEASPETPKVISREHAQALATLPTALDADIRKIRQATQMFSAVLVPQSSSAQVAAQAARPAKIRNILLVEDETIHQDITVKQLGEEYLVEVAAGGKAALEASERGSHDLILLDMVLPGTEIRGLIKGLRERHASGVPIVVVSNMPLVADELRELGVDGALEKPFRRSSFLELLERLA